MYELNLMPPLKMYRPGCLVHVVFLSVAHVFGNKMPGGKCFLLSRHAHFQLGRLSTLHSFHENVSVLEDWGHHSYLQLCVARPSVVVKWQMRIS